MSKEIYKWQCLDYGKTISLTSYYGGSKNGTCLQITIGGEYISLTKNDVIKLAAEMLYWLRGLIK